MTGTGFGAGTINMIYHLDDDGDAFYDRDATEARYSTVAVNSWWAAGGSNTVSQGNNLGVVGLADANTFLGETAGTHNCGYNGTKTIPDTANNLYHMNFDVTQLGFSNNCAQIGTGFTGMMTIVDGGSVERFIDGTLWFAATNGQFSTFGTPVYFDAP
jgi:hypothetical protein